MASQLTNDFKSEFALLLVIMKVNYGVTNALNYSSTLYGWTLAALVTEGKIRITVNEKGEKIFSNVKEDGFDFSSSFAFAKKKYMAALEFMKQSQGRKEWVQQSILNCCFEIDEIIFPIALSEGILDLKDVTNKIGAGMAGLQVGVENFT